mgnify:FL=1|tara:strand:- start:2634 stop:3086 length:453 start_codon:yes stop_codon:yes gene_type:complete
MDRKYELVYIVSPEGNEDQVADLHTQIETIVQDLDGKIDKTENLGRRKLAYEIGPHKEGTYVIETIFGSGELLKEIERRLKVNDLVIRYLAVRIDEEELVIGRARENRLATSRRRRTARGLSPDRQPGEGQHGENGESPPEKPVETEERS